MMWALDIAAVSQAAITVKGQLFKKDGGGGGNKVPNRKKI